MAGLLGCDPTEVVFTSGGSESNNHDIKGVFFANRDRRDHIITTAVEHPATINPCRFLEKLGAKVTVLPVGWFGRIDPGDVRKALTSKTILATVMHANNEVRTIEPTPGIAAIAREAGIPFHTDAAQTVGKLSTDVEELGVDLLSVAGHKVYAPKGIGEKIYSGKVGPWAMEARLVDMKAQMEQSGVSAKTAAKFAGRRHLMLFLTDPKTGKPAADVAGKVNIEHCTQGCFVSWRNIFLTSIALYWYK